MTEGWAYTGGPPASGSLATISLVEGRSFCVSGPSGDIGTAGGHGLVVKDTRFLDHLELRVDGEPLEPLTVEHIGPHAAVFVRAVGPGPGSPTAPCSWCGAATSATGWSRTSRSRTSAVGRRTSP